MGWAEVEKSDSWQEGQHIGKLCEDSLTNHLGHNYYHSSGLLIPPDVPSFSSLSRTTHSSTVQPKSESSMTLHHISLQDSTTVPSLGNVMEWGRKTSLIAIRRWQNLLATEELLFYLLFVPRAHTSIFPHFLFFIEVKGTVNLSSLQLCGVSTVTTLHSRGNRGPLRGHKLPPFLNWGDWAAL